MRYSNVDFNVVYVDPSRGTAGDGTTPAKALKSLPATAADFQNNTCYIIRRTAESSACVVPNGTNYDITNLLIMGMPMASDAMWELVPSEARTAWGSDSAQFANVQSTVASGSFQLPYIQHFLLHRVYLFRDAINADNYILKFYNSSDFIGCYSFEHCKFGSKGINLDVASYSGEFTASRCKSYVYVYYARMVNISDCTINHAITGNSSNGDGIYVYWADVLNVQDVRVYSAAWTDYGQYYPLHLSYQYSKGVECNIVNVTQTVRRNGSASHVPLLMYVQGYISMNVRNVKVVTGNALSTVKPSSYVIDYPMIYFGSCYEMNLDGVDVNLTECWNCKAAVLSMSRCYASSYVPGVAKPIKNVTVKLADTAGIGSPITYANATQSGESYAAVVMDFSSSDAQVYAKVPCVDNILVKCYRGKAFYGNNVRLTEAEFEGGVFLQYSVADIKSVKTWFPGKALFAGNGTHMRVRELVCNTENPTYPYNEDPAIASTYSDNGSIFVDESNTALYPMTEQSGKASHIYQGFGCNNEGAEGHFAYRCANGLADTWSVHRQGGGASALKIYNNVCTQAETMVLGRRPFNGMQLLPTTTGRHIVKAYIAFKGYAKPAEMYRQFFLSVQVGGRTYYSTLHGRWSNDPTSVWVNDTDLTQMVLELPIDIDEVKPVDVRAYFSWYAAGGFVYLDPDIKLMGA